MNPKSWQDTMPEFYMTQPNGTKVVFGEVKGIKIITEPDPDYYDIHHPLVVNQSEEIELTVKWIPSTKALYFLTHGRLPSNNWLKMHGQKPERKIR